MKLLMTIEDVETATGISRSSINRLILENRFPPAVKIGGNKRWRVKDVVAWTDSLCEDPVLTAVQPAKRGRPRLAV